MEDVLAAYDAAAQLDDPKGVIVNVGSGRQHSVRTVSETIMRLCGYDQEPHWGAVVSSQPETSRWMADVTQAQALLGWVPTTPLEIGLDKTIHWFRRNLDHYD
jgi:nucleoside-diphosphate-sugar epimerase